MCVADRGGRYDFSYEKSGNGVALASGYCAGMKIIEEEENGNCIGFNQSDYSSCTTYVAHCPVTASHHQFHKDLKYRTALELLRISEENL